MAMYTFDIIYVDDEGQLTVMFESFMSMLYDAKYSVRTYNDPRTLSDEVRNDKTGAALWLLDVMMDGIDGVELADQIRKKFGDTVLIFAFTALDATTLSSNYSKSSAFTGVFNKISPLDSVIGELTQRLEFERFKRKSEALRQINSVRVPSFQELSAPRESEPDKRQTKTVTPPPPTIQPVPQKITAAQPAKRPDPVPVQQTISLKPRTPPVQQQPTVFDAGSARVVKPVEAVQTAAPYQKKEPAPVEPEKVSPPPVRPTSQPQTAQTKYSLGVSIYDLVGTPNRVRLDGVIPSALATHAGVTATTGVPPLADPLSPAETLETPVSSKPGIFDGWDVAVPTSNKPASSTEWTKPKAPDAADQEQNDDGQNAEDDRKITAKARLLKIIMILISVALISGTGVLVYLLLYGSK